MRTIIIITCLYFSCFKVFAEPSKTSIVIHYKGDFDRNEMLKFQIYQNFALEDYILVNPPKFEMTEGLNFIKYDFFIEQPQVLNIGFHSVYIEPGKHANLNYAFLGKDDTGTPIETFTSNDDESLIIRVNGNTVYSKQELFDKFNTAITSSQFSFFFDLANLEIMINRNIKEIYEKNLKGKNTTVRDKYFKEIICEDYLITLLKKFNYSKQSLNVADQLKVIEKATLLIQNLAKDLDVKNFQYYLSLQELYKLKYQKNWKEIGYEPSKVKASLNEFDTISKEYFILNIFKQNLIDIKRDSINLSSLKLEITIPILQKYLKSYLTQKNVGHLENGFISNTLRNLEVYNSQNQKGLLGDLFSETKQEFIYLDFCGSWCKPCLSEMETYSNSERKFDHSDLVRPIWLFFENNQLDWLKTIAKFNLPKENCYLVTEPTLQKYFSEEFEWKGEFPHHFVFQKDGLIIDKNANNLMFLNENELKKNSQSITTKQSLIPLPPRQ